VKALLPLPSENDTLLLKKVFVTGAAPLPAYAAALHHCPASVIHLLNRFSRPDADLLAYYTGHYHIAARHIAD